MLTAPNLCTISTPFQDVGRFQKTNCQGLSGGGSATFMASDVLRTSRYRYALRPACDVLWTFVLLSQRADGRGDQRLCPALCCATWRSKILPRALLRDVTTKDSAPRSAARCGHQRLCPAPKLRDASESEIEDKRRGLPSSFSLHRTIDSNNNLGE